MPGLETRWNLLAFAVVAGALLVGYVFLPHWSTRYGAYLVAFAVWMIWFVATGVRVVENLDR